MCERCGTPFAYEVPEGYQEEVSRAKQSNSPSTPPPAYRNRQQQQRRVNMNRHSMNYEDEELYADSLAEYFRKWHYPNS